MKLSNTWTGAEGTIPSFVNVLRVRTTSEGTVILDLGYIDSEATPEDTDNPILVTKVVMPLSLYKKLKEPLEQVQTKVWCN